jgi:predicted transcriptional regulator
MKTVILEVKSAEDAVEEFSRAWKSGKQQTAARISFSSPELLWKVLTAKRWEILKSLCGAGPVSIRETARRVKRDVKSVHRDVIALIGAGLLARTEKGGVEFPYDAIKVEFFLQAA